MNIPLDPLAQAFHAGIRVGSGAAEALAQVPADTPYLVRMQYFWLKVGSDLPAKVRHGGLPALDAFVTGASTCKPTSHFALVLHTPIIRPAENVARPEHDRDTTVAADLADLLDATGKQIRVGLSSGPVRDRRGRLIGELTITPQN
jgi:hypothetical protein